ncbi:MAG: DUF4838 domain-containing protein [Desulfamplus sp.]|nr:DUF4838 domain-containing protein [Desulfamplus sp.]
MVECKITAIWATVFIIFAFTDSSLAKDSSIFITINSKPNAVIVTPSKPTLREEFAAKELQKYIKKISGATLPIKKDLELLSKSILPKPNSSWSQLSSPKTHCPKLNPSKSDKSLSNNSIFLENSILIGGPERNLKTAELISEQNFDELIPGPEGIMIKSFSNRFNSKTNGNKADGNKTDSNKAVVLAGSSKNPYEYERGTIYAVYEFLEKYLGCSFASYGLPDMEIGEYVPKVPSIRVGEISYLKNRADNLYRTAILQYYNTSISPNHGLNSQFIDWAAKNRYNRILTMESIYTAFKHNGMFAEAQKRGILFTVGHHESSRLFLPPDGNSYFKEKYYETHPEYYRLQKDGTRLHNKTPWRDSWILCSRNQNGINQFADNVKSWLALNPYIDVVCIWSNDLKGSQCVDELCRPYSKVENYAYFVNEVAKRVNKVYPDVKIDMLAYSDIFNCPEGVKLQPSIIIDESTWSNKGLRKIGKKDGSSLIGTTYEINAKKWHNLGATVVFYEYFMGNFNAKQKYLPMADEMQPIFSYFKNSGYYQGSGTQIEVFNIWNCLFNFYTHARTSYDTTLSMNDNLDRFCKIFGAGSYFIKSYIEYVESIIDGQVRYNEAGTYLAVNADKAKVYDLFEKAYIAEKDEKLRNNIRLMRMAFRYSDLSTNIGSDNKLKELRDGELRYMYDNFDSYSHNLGYGIYIAITKTVDSATESINGYRDKSVDSERRDINSYKPDKWYEFR